MHKMTVNVGFAPRLFERGRAQGLGLHATVAAFSPELESYRSDAAVVVLEGKTGAHFISENHQYVGEPVSS